MRWEFDREFDWSFTLMSACGGSDLAKQGAFNNIIHGIARQYPVAEAFRQAFGRLCNVHSLMQGYGPTCYSYKRNMSYNLQHTEHDEHIHCVSVS